MQAEEFRNQINELKRKMEAVKAAPAELPPDALVKVEDDKPSPDRKSNRSPPSKRHKSSSKDAKLEKDVLNVVKEKLDRELKRGSITQDEYKDIAKRATNKVVSKHQRDPVRLTLLPAAPFVRSVNVLCHLRSWA